MTKILFNRNGPFDFCKKMRFQQLINLSYSDDAQMMTMGGILYKEADQAVMERCGFNDLLFYRDGDDPYVIKAPILTPREIRYLNTLLPKKPATSLKLPGVPESDLEAYEMIYRYYPSFVESFLG